LTRVCILNIASTSTNWGLNACSTSLEHELHSHASSLSSVDYNIIHSEYITDHFTLLKKQYYLPIRSHLLQRFIPKSLVIPQIFDDFQPILDLWLCARGGINSHHILELIASSDIIYFNAEGSCYRKNYGARVGLFLLWLSRVVFRKRSIFINGSVTLTSVDNVLHPMIFQCFLEGVEFFVREEYSLRILNSIDVKAVYVPDSAFSVVQSTPQTNPIYPESGDYFCVSKSMLQMSRFRMSSTGLDPFATFILTVQKKFGWRPVFLAKDTEDLYIRSYRKAIVGSLAVSNNLLSDELLSVIRGARLLLSGRYHHVIFAMCAGTPFVPLDTTSHKIRGLLSGTPYHDCVLDPTSLSLQIPHVEDIVVRSLKLSKAYDSIDDSRKRYKLFQNSIASHFS